MIVYNHYITPKHYVVVIKQFISVFYFLFLLFKYIIFSYMLL